MSACIAARFATVSSTVSPLVAEEILIARLSTSADSRLAAISKVVRVRVEGSKKRLNTVFPRRSGTFFTSRWVTPTNDFAVSRICHRIPAGSPSSVSRWCSSPCLFSCGLDGSSHIAVSGLVVVTEAQAAVRQALELDRFIARDLECRPCPLRRDRKLASTAVDERGQPDARRPAVVEQFIHRGADGAPGEQDVVHQHERPAFDVEWNSRALDVAMQSDELVVVAIEGNVECAERNRETERGMKPLREPYAARVNADESGIG